jgi:hypothetical protein
LVLPEVVISATALAAVVWFEPLNVNVGCDVYPLPFAVIVTVDTVYPPGQLRELVAIITAVATAPDPPPPLNPIDGGVEEL